jgi:hypothetical protein
VESVRPRKCGQVLDAVCRKTLPEQHQSGVSEERLVEDGIDPGIESDDNGRDAWHAVLGQRIARPRMARLVLLLDVPAKERSTVRVDAGRTIRRWPGCTALRSPFQPDSLATVTP